jgi:TnpA family transposase
MTREWLISHISDIVGPITAEEVGGVLYWGEEDWVTLDQDTKVVIHDRFAPWPCDKIYTVAGLCAYHKIEYEIKI